MADEQKVKDIMVTDVITINKNASIEELSALLLDNKISGVPVLDDNRKLVGVATEGDLIVKDSDLHFPRYFKLLDSIIYLESLNKFKKNLKKYLGTKVEDVMTTDIRTINKDATVREAANMMIRYNINRLPVMDGNDDLVGIVTRADIVRSMISE